MANGNLPDVVQMMLCEAVAYDLNSDSWVLVRPYTRLRLGPHDEFPVVVERSALYFELMDAFGEFRLHVEIRNTANAGVLGFVHRTTSYTIQLPPDRSAIEDVIHLPPIPFLEEAEYEFRLFANGQPLGSRSAVFLNVKRNPTP